MSFNIFLSHRHQDAAIAEALHNELSKWVGNHASIYRSSKPGEGRPGADLNEFLKSKLRETDLFILVFTLADEDWSYCMWELGVVTGHDTKPTQVVVFNCTDQQPAVRLANLTVNARETGSIMNFVKPFHDDPDWLILHDKTKAGARDLVNRLKLRAEDGVDSFGESLMEALKDVLPEIEPDWTERLEYFTFRLSPEHVKEVRRLRSEALEIQEDDDREEEYENLREDAKSILRKNLTICDLQNKSAANRFDLEKFEAETSFKNLIKHWRGWFKEHYGRKPEDKEVAWVDALLRDLSRATAGKRSQPGSELMTGALQKGADASFQPVVVRTQALADGGMDYAVYFFKVPTSPG